MINKDQTIIIGGGPGGSSAAIYLARFCHRVILFDAPEKVHGRTAMATNLANFLSHFEKINGTEFLTRVSKQLKKLSIERYNEKVVKVTKKQNGNFVVFTEKNLKYEAKYLIVAVGLSDNMPKIEGLGPYYDTAIFHCMTCDWYDHKNKKIAVIANDNEGIIAALKMKFYYPSSELVVVPSKNIPKFSARLLAMAENQKIRVYKSPLMQLIGSNGFLKKIKLNDLTLIPCEAIFTRLGYERFDDFLDKGNISLKRDEFGFIKVNINTYESSIKNLFAVGPCNDGPAQAIIAAGEGALTALEIDKRILLDNGIPT